MKNIFLRNIIRFGVLLLTIVLGDSIIGQLEAQEEGDQLIYLPLTMQLRDPSTISPTGPYLGDVVEGGGYSFTALSVINRNDPSPSPPYQQLLEFEVVIGNVSGERIAASSHFLVVEVKGGEEYPMFDEVLYPHQLEPGERAKGRVSFLVREGLAVEEIKFKVPNSSIELKSKIYTQTGKNLADPDVPLTNGSPVDREIDSKLGDLVQKGEHSLQALTVEDPGTPGVNYPPVAVGKRLVDIEVAIGNMSDERTFIGPENATLIDSEGYLYIAESTGREGAIEWPTLLQAGGEVRGWVSFLIPDDVVIESLKFQIYGNSYLVLQTGLEE